MARSNAWKRLLGLLSLLLLVPVTARANHIPLNTDLQAYLLLGLRTTRISTLRMEPGPGCNVGVNCIPIAGERGACGFFHGKHSLIPVPGQVVANQVCGTEFFYQVFANSLCSDPTCAEIGHAGSKPDCTDPYTTPIIGDLDGDNVPSCDSACVSDQDDVAAACGVTLPLPACDPLTPVRVDKGMDCSIADVIPGNGRCDLAAGTYGSVRVNKGGRIDFAPGTTILCGLRTQAAVRVTTQPGGPAEVLVPGTGIVKFNNSADVGGDCGDLSIVTERGLIKLGRYGDYTLDACTIAGQLRLGHSNNLKGHYLGDVITSDKDNDGRCTCNAGLPPPPTTSTTSSTTTTTSTTTSSSTSSSPTTSTTSSTASTTSTTATTATTMTSTTATTATTATSTTATTATTATSTTATTATTATSTTATTATTATTTSSTATTESTTTTTSSTTSTTGDPGTTTTATTTTATTTATTATTATTTSSTTATVAPTTTSSTTTTATSSTTSTTAPAGQFTRTPGFYKNHPDVTQQILTDSGGLVVCGHAITDVDVNHGHSALEALCISVKGVQRAQLLRHLVTAALTMAAGGKNYTGYSACNAVCTNPSATTSQLANCIDQTDAYNNSGDNVMAPWDPPGSANPNPCKAAFDTACTVLSPGPCAAP